MFPKAHASAYVLMAVRIAYFKVHHPILFYATYLSVRARDFDLGLMVKGSSAIRGKINEISSKGNDDIPKEKNLLTVLQVTLEIYERGFTIQKVDLYKSDATDFKMQVYMLVLPFKSVE